MRFIKFIPILVFLVFSNASLLAQKEGDISSMNKKQIRKLAEGYENAGDYYSACTYYECYLQKDTSKIQIYFRLGELYKKSRDYVKASNYYLKAYQKDGKNYADALFKYAQMLKSQGKYVEAIDQFNKFATKGKDGSADKALAKLVPVEIEGCKLGIHLHDTASRINAFLLDTTINKAHVDFAPIPVNDTTLIYSSLRTDKVPTSNADSILKTPSQQMYQANLRNTKWKFTSKLVGPFNDTAFNCCNGTFSSDSSRFYFTRCKLNWKNQMICRIFVSELITEQWQTPVELSADINDDNYTTTMPSIGKESKNGYDILYFVSDRPGGKGGLDIWYSIYNDYKKTYSPAKNAGAKINTSGDELTPFYDINNHTLYFSSNGWTNIGGYDVFQSTGELTQWSAPENLGAPINSPANDMYYIFNKNRGNGFFVSNRIGGIALMSPTCCYDIYNYKYLEYFNTIVKGKLFSSKSDLDKSLVALTEADVQLYKLDKEGNINWIRTVTVDKKGAYQFKLEPETDYRLIYTKEDYLSNSFDISTRNMKRNDTVKHDAILEKQENDKPIVLKNIYFEFDKAILTESSKKILDTTIFVLLQANNDLIVEIGAHTDSLGSDSYNMSLSNKRAESVVNYLIAKGIDKKQLKFKGYGETQPIATNSTDAGRQKNRRIEFKIVGNIGRKMTRIQSDE